VLPELEAVEEKRSADGGGQHQHGRRSAAVENHASPGGRRQREEEAERGQHVCAADSERGDERRADQREELRRYRVRMVTVNAEGRIQEVDGPAAHARQVDVERAGGMCDRVPRGDQLQPWVAHDERPLRKPAREQQQRHREHGPEQGGAADGGERRRHRRLC